MRRLGVCLLACLPAAAQITAEWQDSGGTATIRLRNDSGQELEAFAISVRYSNRTSRQNDPVTFYADRFLPGPAGPGQAMPAAPLAPGAVYGWTPALMLPRNPKSGDPVVEPPAQSAGIFADGTAVGNPRLLTLLLLRRANFLAAVETTLELLNDAAHRNVARESLVARFQQMADQSRRWYLPAEQRVGLPLYQAMAGKIRNLPEGELGSPFPPAQFVERETAALLPVHAALLESQPSLADFPRVGR